MGIRIRDIAEKLKLSSATVSLALNNRRGVSEEVRGKVLSAARNMGYSKAPPHRGISETDAIQLLIFKQSAAEQLDTSFFTRMAEGIDSTLSAAHYRLMITYVTAGSDIPARLESIRSSGVRGIILLATELSSAYVSSFLTLDLPMVVLDGYFEELPMDFVTINNVQGAFAATAYLGGAGHREIGYLTSRVRTVNFSERHEGYNKALKKLGLTKKAEYTLRLSPALDSAYFDMLAYLDSGIKLPTAFFADNDILAAGAIRALKERDYHIPGDISVVGFDDIPLCRLLSPELTTVSVPKKRLGVLAVERLLARINGDTSEYVKIEIGTQIIIRGSSAPSQAREKADG